MGCSPLCCLVEVFSCLVPAFDYFITLLVTFRTTVPAAAVVLQHQLFSHGCTRQLAFSLSSVLLHALTSRGEWGFSNVLPRTPATGLILLRRCVSGKTLSDMPSAALQLFHPDNRITVLPWAHLSA